MQEEPKEALTPSQEEAPSEEQVPSPEGKTQASSGLNQNVAAALSYFLFFITGIVFLLIEKENKFVRFHAMQSTLTFGGLFVANLVLTFIPFLGWAISALLSVVGVILWIVLMIKAYQGEEYELPVVGQIARDQVGKMS